MPALHDANTLVDNSVSVFAKEAGRSPASGLDRRAWRRSLVAGEAPRGQGARDPHDSGPISLVHDAVETSRNRAGGAGGEALPDPGASTGDKDDAVSPPVKSRCGAVRPAGAARMCRTEGGDRVGSEAAGTVAANPRSSNTGVIRG